MGNFKENLLPDTPDYCADKTKAFPCSCTAKLAFLTVLPAQLKVLTEWHCHRGVAGGSGAVIHSHPALCCSFGSSQGTNAPLHVRDSAIFRYWEISESLHFSFVLLESWVTILYLGSETNFHHLPLHGKRMSSSWGSICLQANKSLQIYFQRCQLVPYMVSSFMHIHFSPM